MPASANRRASVASLAFLAVAAARLEAQAVAREFRESLVATAAPGEVLGSAPSYSKAVARGRDGAWWLMLGRFAAVAKGAQQVWRVELWRSVDGMQWEQRAICPLRTASCGSIVADALTAELHLLLSLSPDGKWSEPWHIAFAVEKGEWVGNPQQLAAATADEDQYFANDIDCTRSGTLVAVIGSHRNPQAKGWNGGWSSGLRTRKPQSKDWSGLTAINVANYCVSSNLTVRGELLDCSYRTCPFGAIVGIRTWDAQKGAFVQPADEVANGPLEDNLGVCNSSVVCADATGGRYVLFVVGGWGPGTGRLCVSYCGPESSEWTRKDVAEDAPLQSGNENYSHFALARGAGNQIVAFYAKVSEDHANLYQRVFDSGELVGEEKLVARDRPGAFLVVSGNKQAELRPGIQVVATRSGESLSRASVVVYGVLPAPMPKPRVVR